MKTSVENIGNNVVKLRIELEAEAFNESIKKAYLKNRNRFSIPGFRKGKAPQNLIERYYGESIFYEEAFNLACPEAYEQALKDNNIQPVDHPELDIEQIGKGKDLVFTAKVTVKPDVKLGEYKGFKIKKDKVKITDDDVKKELERIQEINARLISIEDRPVKDKDIVNIDFEGFVDGEPIEGGSAKGYSIVIGSGSFIPGFEEQLIGVEKGSTKEIKVTFPEDYGNESLKGKEAVFNVTVNEIKEKELPDINDEFAQDVSEFDTLEEYKADIRKKLEENAKNAADKKYEDEVIKKVVDNAEVDVPEVMVERQIDEMMRRLDLTLRYQGMDINSYMEVMKTDVQSLRNEHREMALKQVKTQLVLEKISQVEQVDASEEEIDAEIAKMAENYKQNAEDFKKHLKNDDIEYIKDTVITRKTIKIMTEGKNESEQ
ncbi:MAG: trigger factor [Clostridiaceae bacterium]|jgi:trigger factor|nr:trigger factor [Clostridiaceae bacterium]